LDIYLIELTNNKASRLIKDLEELNIIKVLHKAREKKDEQSNGNAARLRGALNLSEEQYKDFQQHANIIRGEGIENIY